MDDGPNCDHMFPSPFGQAPNMWKAVAAYVTLKDRARVLQCGTTAREAFAPSAHEKAMYDAIRRGTTLTDLDDLLVYVVQRNGPVAHVAFLLAMGAHARQLRGGIGNEDGNALMRACHHGHTPLVVFLVGRVDVNARNSQGTTALMLAARGRHVAVVRVLLQRADVTLQDVRGRTALNDAVLGDGRFGDDRRRREAVQMLLQHPDVRVNPPRGHVTPLMDAASVWDAGVIDLLRGHGADPNRCVPDAEEDRTALGCAFPPVCHDWKAWHYPLVLGAIEALLRFPTLDPNLPIGDGGWTAQMAAASIGLPDVAALLVADPRTNAHAPHDDAGGLMAAQTS